MNVIFIYRIIYTFLITNASVVSLNISLKFACYFVQNRKGNSVYPIFNRNSKELFINVG